MVKFQSWTGSPGFPACKGTLNIHKIYDEGPATIRKWMNQFCSITPLDKGSFYMDALTDIQKYYKQNLCDRNFVFDTEVGRIVLRFEESNFAHLTGLHHFDKSYKGKNAWDNIANGLITLKKLKNMNNKAYRDTLVPRIEVTYNVLDVFSKCKVIKKYVKQDESRNSFDCDFVLYNSNDGSYYVITCFIDKQTKSFCSAASFLKFYTGDLNLMKYINPSNPEICINKYMISADDCFNDIDYKMLNNIVE